MLLVSVICLVLFKIRTNNIMIVLSNDKLKQRRIKKKIHVRRQFNKLINNIYNIRRDMPVYLEDCTHEINDYINNILSSFS